MRRGARRERRGLYGLKQWLRVAVAVVGLHRRRRAEAAGATPRQAADPRPWPQGYGQARERGRDVILPDWDDADWYEPSRLLSVALTRSERGPNDRANTNGTDGVPSGQPSIVAISPGRGRCWGH